MILSDCLTQARHILRTGGIETPDLDARLLLTAAAGFSAEDMILKSTSNLPAEALEKFNAFIKRRLAHEPVSRILGEREFWGLPFKITPDTLDPRPDSETLVHETLQALNISTYKNLRIADLGTGTGCLLLALLSELPKAQGTGFDISEGAIRTAKENAEILGLQERAFFQVTDWENIPPSDFDWIISNPPYIAENEAEKLTPEVRNFDPHGALFAGKDGLECYRVLARILPCLLAPDGGASLEIGFNQADQVSDIFKNYGFNVLKIAKDIQNHDRCVIIKKNLPKKNKKS